MSDTALVLCAGGGGSSIGIQAAGVQVVGAVEFDQTIAAHYATVFDHAPQVQPVQDTDFAQFTGVDGVQGSPSCKKFSQANSNKGETIEDLEVAEAHARAIRIIKPRWFWLEQVEGYAKSKSCGIIRKALDDGDYWSHAAVVNAADYGVPQTRRRYILRAVRGGLWQPFRPLPPAQPWIGWYAAILDLLDTLPPDQFAPWQLARLPEALESIGYLVGGTNTSTTFERMTHARAAQEPTFTVLSDIAITNQRAFLINGANTNRDLTLRVNTVPVFTLSAQDAAKNPVRAFLVDAQYSGGPDVDGVRKPNIVGLTDPAFTIGAAPSHAATKAFLVGAQYTSEYGAHLPLQAGADTPSFTTTVSSAQRGVKAWLEQGRVVRMTTRALARFQSVPDWYPLPTKTALACTIIGNMVPPLLAQAVTQSLLEDTP